MSIKARKPTGICVRWLDENGHETTPEMAAYFETPRYRASEPDTVLMINDEAEDGIGYDALAAINPYAALGQPNHLKSKSRLGGAGAGYKL